MREGSSGSGTMSRRRCSAVNALGATAATESCRADAVSSRDGIQLVSAIVAVEVHLTRSSISILHLSLLGNYST